MKYFPFVLFLILVADTHGFMRGRLGKALSAGELAGLTDDLEALRRESLSPNAEAKIRTMNDSVHDLERSIDKAKYSIADNTSTSHNTTAFAAETRRRNELAWAHFQPRIDMCIGMIRGGSDIVARNLVRAIESLESVDDVCPLLKRIEFPKLYRHGYHDETAVTSKGKRDVDVFFSSQKERVFRCMCEFFTPLRP